MEHCKPRIQADFGPRAASAPKCCEQSKWVDSGTRWQCVAFWLRDSDGPGLLVLADAQFAKDWLSPSLSAESCLQDDADADAETDPAEANKKDVESAMSGPAGGTAVSSVQTQDKSGAGANTDKSSLSDGDDGQLEATQQAEQDANEERRREARNQAAEASLKDNDSAAESLSESSSTAEDESDEAVAEKKAASDAAEATGEVDPADDQKASLQTENQSAGTTAGALSSVQTSAAGTDAEEGSGDAAASSGGSASIS